MTFKCVPCSVREIRFPFPNITSHGRELEKIYPSLATAKSVGNLFKKFKNLKKTILRIF